MPPEYYEAGREYFRRVVDEADGLIGTGFIGTPALLPALTLHGMADLAEKIMFLNRKVPGWLYQVERGATSIWERWDAMGEDGTIYDPDMNSYNHYAYGAVCQWLFEGVAGVAPVAEAPGFDEVTLDPLILPALSPVQSWHDCRHGRIEAAWSVSGDAVTYKVTLPAGCTGRLTANPARRDVCVAGKSVAVPAGTGPAIRTPRDYLPRLTRRQTWADQPPGAKPLVPWRRKTMRLIPSAALLAAFTLIAGLAEADTVLSITTDGNAETVAAMDALTAAYTAAHPDVTFEIESRPGGADGDNLVKTRLATGEPGDIIQYNSGSLFQALNPTDSLADLSDIRAGQYHRQLQAGRDRLGRHHPRRAVWPGHGRRHILQQEDLCRAWPVGAQDLGRIHGQQRKDQGCRQGCHGADLWRHLDQPAVRAG